MNPQRFSIIYIEILNPIIANINILVGGGIGERCGSQSNTVVASVKYSVESLQERLAVDKVESRSTPGANAANNQVNSGRNTANESVKGTRPDLTVRSQSECSAANDKVQSLQITELSTSDTEQTSRSIDHPAGGRLVF